VLGDVAEIVQEIMHHSGEPDALGVLFEPVLKGAEKSFAARQRRRHGPQLAQHFLPRFYGSALPRPRKCVEDLLESRQAAGLKVDRHFARIDDPSQYFFSCTHVAITLR
jgi:hypothetical protein